MNTKIADEIKLWGRVPVFVCAMRAREVKAQIQIYRP